MWEGKISWKGAEHEGKYFFPGLVQLSPKVRGLVPSTQGTSWLLMDVARAVA